jgi:hypothetical protein
MVLCYIPRNNASLLSTLLKGSSIPIEILIDLHIIKGYHYLFGDIRYLKDIIVIFHFLLDPTNYMYYFFFDFLILTLYHVISSDGLLLFKHTQVSHYNNIHVHIYSLSHKDDSFRYFDIF